MSCLVCLFHSVSVVIALGKRPVTFRTRKLSLSAPMVLQGGPCGRVGRRRTIIQPQPPSFGSGVGAFLLSFTPCSCLGGNLGTSTCGGRDVRQLMMDRQPLRDLGIGSGDEVIVPSFAPESSAVAVVMVGATPVFADIDPRTYCLDPASVEAALTPRTSAVLAVHQFGHPAPMRELGELAARQGIALVEEDE